MRLRQTIKRLCQSTVPSQWMMFHGPRNASAVALTFDDGPHPLHTPQLLDELARLNVKATFFVLGEAAVKYPDLVRRIHREGHVLGHHTWTHADLAVVPSRFLLDEVRKCRELLESLIGQRCNLFRPPRGHLTFLKTCSLWRQQQQIILWNVNPEDFAMRSAAEAVLWGEQYAPQPGDIVLMHDDHAQVVPLVQTVVQRIESRQMHTATIADWT